MRLIDADALKETICTNVYPITDNFNSQDYGMFWTGGIEKAIDDAPTVDTERHGHWKDVQNYYDDVYYECSACGEPWILLDGTPSDNNMNYCPNCGALMDEIVDANKIGEVEE